MPGDRVTIELTEPGAPRDALGRYRNSSNNEAHGGRDAAKFLLEMRRMGWSRPTFPKAPNDPAWLAANRTETAFTWVGHATFLVQAGGLNILTDPVLSKRTSPVQWAGPGRVAPLGLTLDELPKIDVVLVSHNHYDHLDTASVTFLARRDAPVFVVPLGLQAWFERRGIRTASELDWWRNTIVRGLRVTAVPAQHFSGRTATDRNRTLWCGFVFEIRGRRYYFAGDTGYGPDFAQIGKRFAPIDVAMIPIGAYSPRGFMGPVHCDPDEAVRIHRDVGSALSLAMHWGTFRLTLEPLDEPPVRLRAAMLAQGVEESAFLVLQHGETLKPSGL
jgi:N-acyl-phosphatidylethanolamine-hydrolysing phospholipase D